MIRAKFEEVANELGCEYEYSEKGHVSVISRNIPASYHKLTVEYNSVMINLVYEFGGHNLGKVKSILETDKNVSNFSVTTRTQFQRLFSKDKQPFKIKSKDPLFKSKIKTFLKSSMYNDIANKTTFEPEISGVKSEGKYTICTDFYMGFEDKELSIIPSIDLHKKILDEILR